MELINIILVLGIYIEMAVLVYLDYKIWNTLYTPLNFLILPYAVILLMCLLVCGNMGVIEFYYPSLIVWMVGLLIFAIPSYVFGLSFQKEIIASSHSTRKFEENFSMRSINITTVVILLMFAFHFVRVLKSSIYLPGSEDFGQDFCGRGFWGHLHRLIHVLVILYIYKYDKKHWYYNVFIVIMLFYSFMYGVKSWVIMPVMAGLAMRIYSGKMHLRFSLIVKMFIFSFIVFIISYSLSLILANEHEADLQFVFDFICNVFVHYVISGIVGWSQDLQLGIVEKPDFNYIIINIVNFINVTTGQELVSAVNPHFLHNGINGSNVRSFFPTIFIRSTYFEFVASILVISSMLYLFKMYIMRNKNLFISIVFYFYASMLLVGWFEYYFYHLLVFEFPAWVFILYVLSKCKFIDRYEDCDNNTKLERI